MPLLDGFPVSLYHPAEPNPIYFVDAAYANNLDKHLSTTGYAIMLAGGAIAWYSKTQFTTALCSTKAEFYAAVSTAKVCPFLCHVLNCLGQPPTGPTLIYEDNQAYINVINAQQPTDCTRHIETLFFKIQDWKVQEVIKLIHIPWIINSSGDLTKPLGWVLHSQHACRAMRHFIPT